MKDFVAMSKRVKWDFSGHIFLIAMFN